MAIFSPRVVDQMMKPAAKEKGGGVERSSEYLGLLVTFIIAAGIAGLILILNAWLGPKNKMTLVKGEPFECGKEPFGISTGHLPVKFCLIAMFFILFDVEIVWLFPWAVLLKELRWTGLFEMFAFIAVLLLGFVYAWKKGALEWEK